MTFSKLYQFGIVYEPNFLERTENYNLQEFRSIKQEYTDRMNGYKLVVNGTAKENIESDVADKSFVSLNNDTLDLPDVKSSPTHHQFQSIQVQTSFINAMEPKSPMQFFNQSDIYLEAEVSVLLEKEKQATDLGPGMEDNILSEGEDLITELEKRSESSFSPAKIEPDLVSEPKQTEIQKESRFGEVLNIEKTPISDRKDSASSIGPFKSEILNKIAIKLDAATIKSGMTSSPPKSEEASFADSMKDYLFELKRLVEFNQDLMNKPYSNIHPVSTPKIVEYSTSDIDDIESPIPKRRQKKVTPKQKKRVALSPKSSTKKQKVIHLEENIAHNTPLPDPALEFSDRNSLDEEIAQLLEEPDQISNVVAKSSANVPEKSVTFPNEEIIPTREFSENKILVNPQLESFQAVDPIDDFLDNPLAESYQDAKPIDDFDEYPENAQMKTPQSKRGKSLTTKRRKIANREPNEPSKHGTRNRKKKLRKSFIDNEWVDADNVTPKQMNVVQNMGDGEYVVVEEIEKTINGVYRNQHSAPKKPRKSSLQKKTAEIIPFKVAPAICKKPTASQVKEAVKNSEIQVFIDLKEQDNFHIGYIGLTKGTEFEGKEIGNAAYIVASGKVHFKSEETDILAKQKDSFMVQKGNFDS
eukprot:NODE_93_length_21530_cov_0.700387.p3 type:complete len:641 gc:universal NODE_93_length_21530_cov_0.700387:15244-17166(+)